MFKGWSNLSKKERSLYLLYIQRVQLLQGASGAGLQRHLASEGLKEALVMGIIAVRSGTLMKEHPDTVGKDFLLMSSWNGN